jgi:uncharacterized membrane protein
MEYVMLILIHAFFAILWGGGAIATGFFVVPAVMEAGPGGGAVMAGVLKRRLPTIMTASSVLVVLSGIRLYTLRLSAEWLATPHGIVLSLGALAGLGAFAIGVFVQRPTANRLGALGAQIAAAGGSPTPEQAAELQALRSRLLKVARVTAWHLIVAALLMSAHQWAARM